ncbi:MAG: type II toxin-antitoxin system VapC family toxin [Gammaproteobacteria bacterium]|nr:type II toxin-antitoxin system VapC family toxin [Gammaproteobacteria bacterium]MBU1655321.1 type II toxin-antitoxin system VapC family toxin [Gammaproteobacteria bacterium]MBU1961466.1 type II toxin-antitoxin system VapC family toxin [Gammaproteobacteria bacterium]
MNVFFDSSSYIKKFIEEHGSAEVDDYCQQASTLGLSIICLPEMLSALNRKVREGYLSAGDYHGVKRQIMEDIEDIQIINLVPEVIECSVSLLENNKLRSLDALHISCALTWNAEIFISSDKLQIQAAENSGLEVIYIQ